MWLNEPRANAMTTRLPGICGTSMGQKQTVQRESTIVIVKRSLYRNEHINPISYGLVPTRNPTTALYFVSYPLSSILRSLQEVSSNPPLDYIKITSHFTPQPPPSFQTSPPKS